MLVLFKLVMCPNPMAIEKLNSKSSRTKLFKRVLHDLAKIDQAKGIVLGEVKVDDDNHEPEWDHAYTFLRPDLRMDLIEICKQGAAHGDNIEDRLLHALLAFRETYIPGGSELIKCECIRRIYSIITNIDSNY